MAFAPGQPEAADRRCHWQHPGHHRQAYLFALVVRNSVPEGHTQSFLQILVMLLMAYVGLIVGANKGDLLNLAALGGIFGGEKAVEEELQNSGYQRDHRWPNRRPRRGRDLGRRP